MKLLLVALSSIALIAVSTPAASAARTGVGVDRSVTERSTPASFKTKPKPGTKARCPVMGHVFTVTASTKLSRHKGRYYAFCCPGCKPKFDKDPSRYVGR